MDRDAIIEAIRNAVRTYTFGDMMAGTIAQAAYDALEAQGLAVVTGWQPIETAPRDGVPFIAKAYVNSAKSGAAWEENHVIWCNDETGEIHNDCEQGWEVDDYSLWMPLPAPPAAQEPQQ